MSIQTSAKSAACLLCGAPGGGETYPYATRWGGKRFDFLRCTGCRATFINPVPDADDFARMYARSNYHDVFYEEVTPGEFDASLAQLGQAGLGTGRLLDFGCGNGAFLRAAVGAGYSGDGVELDADAIASAARNTGCEVFSLEALEASGRTYDAVHLGDVLEHLPDPAAMLRRLRDRLRPGGLFLVEGPLEDNKSLVYFAASRIGAVKRRVKGPADGSFAPFHLWRTDVRSQRRFFERTLGYRTVSFTVNETGWPYPSAWRAVRGTRSPGALLRFAIGKASIPVASVLRKAGLEAGNRFIAVLDPADV